MSDFTTFINSLCYWDQQRFGNIYQAYLGLERASSIEDIWYNENSWYVFISLENWITIAEAFNWVEFNVWGEDENEYFFDTYSEALEVINNPF